jgi:hypothetical protein
MTVTKRATANAELPPCEFVVGDVVNVDGIGAALEVISVKRGASDWSLDVRMPDLRTWTVPPGRCWKEEA